MSEERNFIINKIKELIQNYSDSMIGYEYKEDNLIHFIKIKPIELYKDLNFKKFCSSILIEYIEKYNGSICFISENDPILLDKPEIYINPGKILKNENYYEINFETQSKITNSISSDKMCLNDNYSLAA